MDKISSPDLPSRPAREMGLALSTGLAKYSFENDLPQETPEISGSTRRDFIKTAGFISLLTVAFNGISCVSVEKKDSRQQVPSRVTNGAGKQIEQPIREILNSWLAEHDSQIEPITELGTSLDFEIRMREIKNILSNQTNQEERKRLEIHTAGFLYDLIRTNVVSTEIPGPDDNLDTIIRKGTANCLKYSRLFEHFARQCGLNAGIVMVERDSSGLWRNHACVVIKTCLGKCYLIDLMGGRFIAKHQRASAIIDNQLAWMSSKELEALSGADIKMTRDCGESLRLLNKAKYLTEEKRFAEAEEVCRQIQTTIPQFKPYALAQSGKLQLERGDFDQAIRSFTEAGELGLAVNPYLKHNLAFSYFSRARPSVENEPSDLDKAIDLLSTIETASLAKVFRAQTFGLLGEAHLKKQMVLKRQDQTAAAEQALTTARINFKKAVELEEHLSTIYADCTESDLEDNTEELEHWESTPENSDIFDINFLWGMDALRNKNFTEAIFYLESGLHADPRNARGYYCLGIAYHRAGRMGENIPSLQSREYLMKAAENYANALELGRPFSAEEYYLMGLAYSSFNNFWAIKFFKRAVDLNPGDPNIYYQLASSYLALGKSVQAVKYFKTAEKLGLDSKGQNVG